MKKYYHFFAIIWNNIQKRKIRAGLTTAGIIIAITTIVALLSIGKGLERGIEEQFEDIGTNRLYISASGSHFTHFQGGLTEEDVKTLEKLYEVEWVNPYLTEKASVEYNNEEELLTIWATKTDNLEKRWEDVPFQIEEGRLFADSEKYSAIIGYKVAKDIFGKEVHVNENILIEGKRFKVIGIFEEVGNPEDDAVIQIPLETAQIIFEKEKQVTVIEVIAKKGTDLQELAKKAAHDLERQRGNDLFEIITPDQLLEQFGTILTIVNILLAAIAGISLVVGAIGIMNATYTSVLERKKEIGIMKAVGAENKTIFIIFLGEAALLGFVGGIIGIGVGFGIGKIVQFGAELAGYKILSIQLDAGITMISLLFAVVVGTLAGVLPAREATQKQIVEALRK